MKRFVALFAALLLLTGCQRPVSLSERAVVKMICISRQRQNYHVKLIAYTAPQSEENADAEREILLAEGEGDAVQTALLDAEHRLGAEALYAQNELLLVEQEAAADRLGEILGYFSQERASRPNTAVYAYQANEEERLLDPDTVQQTVKLLEGQKNSSGQDGGLVQMIYRFDLNGEVEDFFLLPRLVMGEGGVQTDALLFFRDRALQLALTGEEMEAAQLLLGELSRYRYLDGANSCTAEDLRLEYTVEDAPQPRLQLALRGEVRDLRSEADPRALCREIENHLAELLGQVILRCCVENRMDPFRFGWWFLAVDADRFAPLLAEGALFQENTVQVTVRLTPAS